MPFAQGTDFGRSIRMPAAFCGIVGILPDARARLRYTDGAGRGNPEPTCTDRWRATPKTPRAQAATRWSGLLGCRRFQSVPPWQSTLAELERREDIKGLRVAYVSDLAGIGVETGDRFIICLGAAAALAKLGTQVEEIAFDVSAAREALSDLARLHPSPARNYRRLEIARPFGSRTARQHRGRPEAQSARLFRRGGVSPAGNL